MDLDYERQAWFPAASRFAEAIAHTSNFPLSYVYAVFLAVSGHLIGRKTFIRYATPLYANSYVTLVGASGVAHKSTAMNLGIESISDFWMTPPLHNVSTRQGLLLAMRESDGQAFLALDELASLLTRKRQDFAADLLISLTELYSCPRSAGTYTRKDPIIVENCYLTVMAGSTMEWIQSSITAQDLMAGFGNRMTFILGDPRPEKDWPQPPQPDEIDFAPLQDFNATCILDERARDMWTDFYAKFQARQHTVSSFVRVLAERIPEKILKNCVVQCAWNRNPVVGPTSLKGAIDWGWYLYDAIARLTPAFEHGEQQVMAAIREGADSKKELYKALGHQMTAEQLKRAIDALRWLGLIRDENGTFKPLDKPTQPAKLR